MEKDAIITYETLFEFLRREKNREELQKIDSSMLKDIREYVKEKKALLAVNSPDDIFASAEHANLERQMHNVKRILKEFYDRREKKIVLMAMQMCRAKNMLMDTSPLLPHERELFDKLTKILGDVRRQTFSLLYALPNNRDGDGVDADDASRQPKEGSEPKELKREVELVEEKEELLLKRPLSVEKKKSLRFLDKVPKFIGPNLEIYGPFDIDDIVDLPEEIADVLINKKKAVVIES